MLLVGFHKISKTLKKDKNQHEVFLYCIHNLKQIQKDLAKYISKVLAGNVLHWYNILSVNFMIGISLFI